MSNIFRMGKRIAKFLLRRRVETFYYARARKNKQWGAQLPESWDDIERTLDLRPGDSVLDVGCAEGLVAIEFAKRGAATLGIDVSSERIAKALTFACEDSVKNVCFRVGDITAEELDPLSYDIVLFLGLYGLPTQNGRIGNKELHKVLGAARRQVFCRVDIEEPPVGPAGLEEIFGTMNSCGFDAACFPRPKPNYAHLIVGIRRGTDVRIPTVPGVMLVPTKTWLSDAWLTSSGKTS